MVYFGGRVYTVNSVRGLVKTMTETILLFIVGGL